MILDEKIKVNVSNKHKRYYLDKGYSIIECDGIKYFEVYVKDLPINSHIYVNCKCEICSKKTKIKYSKYIKNTKNNTMYYSCSQKCSYKKTIKTNLDKYGVEHPSKTELFKNKIIDTCLKKYGVSNVFQHEDIKKKIKETNLDKYGVEYSIQSQEIQDKIIENNKIKYNLKAHQSKNVLNNLKTKIDSEKYKILSYNYETKTIDLYHSKCNSINSIHKDILNDRIRYFGCEYCIHCNKLKSPSSSPESLITQFLKEININSIENDRTILEGKELDIYIPDLNLAIEFNGLYWHSENFKDKDYHLNKTLECEKKGIQLLHIFEDDWNYKQEIIKSIIKNKLGKIDNKIYARKCIIKEVKSNVTREFLDTNHIQGFSKSTYKIGLYHDNELVSLMTFGYRKTNSKKEFELIRFCNKLDTNVVGASSKLFKYFINNYKDNIEESYILSYADISMFDGQMYDTLGFNEIHLTKPNYFWVVDKKREHRWKYNKQALIKEGFDGSKTEVEIMHERGHYRIYGCGQKRYEYKLKYV